MHSLLAVKSLAPEHKEAWGALFNYYLFDTKIDPAEHIPEYKKDILGKLDLDAVKQAKAWIVRRMQG
jgi:hypothetical protein